MIPVLTWAVVSIATVATGFAIWVRIDSGRGQRTDGGRTWRQVVRQPAPAPHHAACPAPRQPQEPRRSRPPAASFGPDDTDRFWPVRAAWPDARLEAVARRARLTA